MKALRYLFALFIVINATCNLCAAEAGLGEEIGSMLTEESAIQHEAPKIAITSTDDALNAIEADIKVENGRISNAMNTQFQALEKEVASAVKTAADSKSDLANPLRQVGDYYGLALSTQIGLAQFKQIKETIASLKNKGEDPAIIQALSEKYPTLDDDIKSNTKELANYQKSIQGLNKIIANNGGKQILEKIAAEESKMKLLSDAEVRVIRIQRYKNLINILDLLAKVNSDVPGASALIDDLKAGEARSNALDRQSKKLATLAPSTQGEQGLADNLEKQYDAENKQTAAQIQAKYGSILGQVTITPANLLRWVKTHPGITVGIILGVAVIAGTVTGAILLAPLTQAKKQQQLPTPRRGRPGA